MTVLSPSPTTWILADGRTGHLNQCLGLADALGVTPEIKRISPLFPWTYLPPRMWLAPLSAACIGMKAGLSPPWPDLLISAGRRTVAPAAAIRRRSPETFAVQIQDPVAFRGSFDLIAAPRHDKCPGGNVISTEGALNRVTPAFLDAEYARAGGPLSDLARPLIGVLIGGTSSAYRMTEAAAKSLLDGLERLSRKEGVGIAATLSRRTGPDIRAFVEQRLREMGAYVWDEQGDNPYYAILAASDALIVTADSISMISEAASTGKPVHVMPLEGGTAKFRAFHDSLAHRGIARTFSGSIETWSYEALAEASRVAAEIRTRLETR